MPKPQRLCMGGCRKLSHGERCRPCRMEYEKRMTQLARTYNQTNTHLFPFQEGKKYLPAEETWWDKVPRSEWQGAYMRETARIEKGVCANYRPTAMPSEWM
jgi:hypothetical protein